MGNFVVEYDQTIETKRKCGKIGTWSTDFLIIFMSILLQWYIKETKVAFRKIFLNNLPVMNESKYRTKGTAMTEDPQKSSCS